MTKQELGELILRSEDMLYHVSMSIFRNEADVEDAVQTTIVKAFEQIDTLRQKHYAKTWLTRILINESKNILRKKSRLLPMDELPEQICEETMQDYSELYRALLTLPEDMRIALTMYYADEFTIKEIGEILHLPTGTVKSRLSRARKQLRNEMER